MTASARRPVRVLSALGPGDVVAAHDDWQSGVRTVTETSLTFSGQEFDAFAALDVPFWAVSSHERATTKIDGENRIENRPRSARGPVSGLAFHAVQARYAFSLLRSARAFQATHALIDSGTTHWFLLFAFRMLGIAVVPNFHNVQWPSGFPPRRLVHRLLVGLDRLFFSTCVRDALGVSPECGRQIAWLSGGRALFRDYRAQFGQDDFATLPGPQLDAGPVRVVFAGRVERNKGVFDLLQMCERLAAEDERRFEFEVCGGGSAYEELQAAVRASRVADRFVLHGKLVRPRLLEVYGRSHLVIVPTRSDFCEGLPMVCAEAILAGRPVITSRVSNALEALQGAVVEAEVDDVDDYVRQIRAVVADPARYRSLIGGTRQVAAQFFDRSRGLQAAVEDCLRPAP
ncbi:MAG: glycosyltransferase [Caldimonas sp.]